MDEIDVTKLQELYLTTDAQFIAQRQVIDNLVRENEHLRRIIELLITNSKSV